MCVYVFPIELCTHFFRLFSKALSIQIVASPSLIAMPSCVAFFHSLSLVSMAIVAMLYSFIADVASAVYGLGLVEAAAVEQLVEESQCSEGEHGEDEEEEDHKAGNIPAIMEGDHLLQ